MCNVGCIIFGAKNLTKKEIKGKKIIEVGSYNVNGSLRPIIESMNPLEYVGVDIERGTGVDIVCNAENIVEKFGEEAFDVVISTELLEHIKDWRKVISNLKNICKTNGVILITTRSYGFGHHAYPYDFWRYELGDMEEIFSDCKILILEKDSQAPGVFVKIKKPNRFVERDLTDYKLYSIVANKRVGEITDKDFRNFYFRRLILKERLKSFIRKAGRFVFSKI
jgi:SAM-dependent methyltransferase